METTIDSDVDERLSDSDDDMTTDDSEAVESTFEGEISFNKTNLSRLVEHSCRVQYAMKATQGPPTDVICGKLASECRHHQNKRAKGHRHPPGYYTSILGRGGTVHGIPGTLSTATVVRQQDVAARRHMKTVINDSPHHHGEDTEIARLRQLQQDQEQKRIFNCAQVC